VSDAGVFDLVIHRLSGTPDVSAPQRCLKIELGGHL
jgi:hypothetical protein